MQKPMSYYKLLIKRWAWVVILGIVICSGTTYIASQFMHPVYQASATVFINFGSASSAYDNTTASLEAVQTYAQLLTSPDVLNPVLTQHRGLTLKDLEAATVVKPETNTQLIEVDVDSRDQSLAMQLANEICQSFQQYANAQLPISVQVLPAELPTDPIKPQPLLYTGIGALVGLGLALTMIVIFEWLDDRLSGPEEVQELLGMEALAIISQVSRKQNIMKIGETSFLAEGCRILCASLNAAQAVKAFKLVMITSALAGEGKSTIAANIATFLAKAGKNVLLVDADLRHPTLDQYFSIHDRKGFSNALLNKPVSLNVESDTHKTSIPRLRVMTAGITSSNPADLLQSPQAMQLFDLFETTSFDYVIFDTAPLLPVADAQILTSRIPAAVLVVDVSKTSRKVLVRAKQLLNRTSTTILGTVLNKSLWSEYGNIHEYQSYAQQSEVDIFMDASSDTSSDDDSKNFPTLVTPVTPLPDVLMDHTDLENGLVDRTITTKLLRLSKNKNE